VAVSGDIIRDDLAFVLEVHTRIFDDTLRETITKWYPATAVNCTQT
jgi:hypothetical protein